MTLTKRKRLRLPTMKLKLTSVMMMMMTTTTEASSKFMTTTTPHMPTIKVRAAAWVCTLIIAALCFGRGFPPGHMLLYVAVATRASLD
jgi:hypothetical protein